MSRAESAKPWTWSNGPELCCGDRIYSERALPLPSGDTLDWFLIVLGEAQMHQTDAELLILRLVSEVQTMNAKRKGARTEYKARRILEAAGYTVLKAGGSLGLFDLVALGPMDVRCIQVKCNGYCSAAEREQLQLLAVPANCSKEIWRFLDRVPAPRIERL